MQAPEAKGCGGGDMDKVTQTQNRKCRKEGQVGRGVPAEDGSLVTGWRAWVAPAGLRRRTKGLTNSAWQLAGQQAERRREAWPFPTRSFTYALLITQMISSPLERNCSHIHEL